jgi:tripartite-type tricarboxylate transporter receptor subunit TctC
MVRCKLHWFFRLLAALVLLVQSASIPAGTGKEWPIRPITLVVPFPAGGSIDAIGRLLAAKLSGELGQTIIVHNRPGANGSIASDAVAHATPDGYTLVLTTIGTHAINQLVNRHVRYDAQRDFTHISLIASTANVLLASPSVDGKTLQDIAEQARHKVFNVAITGYGSSNHVAMALFKQNAGLKLNDILYKGDAVALNDMLGGQVELMFVNTMAALPHVKAKRLRALAVTSRTRSELLPDVPTMGEAGFDVVIDAWVGLAGPPGLPTAIVERLNVLTTKVLLGHEMRERLAESGTSPLSSSPQEASAFIVRELDKWAKVIKAAGLAAE